MKKRFDKKFTATCSTANSDSSAQMTVIVESEIIQRKTIILFVICIAIWISVVETSAQCPTARFTYLSNSNSTINPNRPVTGDFNRDGNPDAVWTNFSLDSITLAIGDGAGGFTLSNFTVGDGPVRTTVGDFNRDGRQDLAVKNNNDDTVSILLGTTTGFLTGTSLTGVSASSITVGDFNRDGIQDLVTVGIFNSFRIYTGNGNGTFTALNPVTTDANMNGIAVGDINRDGKDDLAISQVSNARVAVFLGDGAGGFGTQTNFGVDAGPDAIQLADLNQDNKLDMIVGNVSINSRTVSVLLGTGTGGFGAVTNYPILIEPRSLSIGDFNGDGKLDIAVGHHGSDAPVSILQNNGNGTFATPKTIAISGSHGDTYIALDDFNKDGKDDIFLTASSGFQTKFYGILKNTCGAPSQYVDFDGDGLTDIAIFRPSTGQWFVLRSSDFSFFGFPFGTNGDIPAAGDYDGDGKTDAAVFRPSSANWFISRSSGGISILTFGTNGDQPRQGDYDGDGKTDIAIFRPSVGEWWVNRSSNGTITAMQFGANGDIPIR